MNRERTYKTPEQAMKEAAQTVRQHLALIPGAKNWNGDLERRLAAAEASKDDITIEWERSWGIGCTLYVQFERGEMETEERRVVWHQRLKATIGWSSMMRSATEAVAAAALYAQVAQVACLIEAQQRESIASVHWKTCETCMTWDHAPGEPCDPLAAARAVVTRAERAQAKAAEEGEAALKAARKAKREKAPDDGRKVVWAEDAEEALAKVRRQVRKEMSLPMYYESYRVVEEESCDE